jgi:hypothetical protein
MEPHSSLPHLQFPATCPYSKLEPSSPCPPFHFLIIHLNIALPSTIWYWKCSISLGFLHKSPAWNSPLPITATCPANLICLDLIYGIIFGEMQRSLSFSFMKSAPLHFYFNPLTPRIQNVIMITTFFFSDPRTFVDELKIQHIHIFICVQKWLTWLYAVLLWFYSLMMVPCEPKYVGIFSVLYIYIYIYIQISK